MTQRSSTGTHTLHTHADKARSGSKALHTLSGTVPNTDHVTDTVTGPGISAVLYAGLGSGKVDGTTQTLRGMEGAAEVLLREKLAWEDARKRCSFLCFYLSLVLSVSVSCCQCLLLSLVISRCCLFFLVSLCLVLFLSLCFSESFSLFLSIIGRGGGGGAFSRFTVSVCLSTIYLSVHLQYLSVYLLSISLSIYSILLTICPCIENSRVPFVSV